MTNTAPHLEDELSDEEFDLDPSAADVEPSQVETLDNADVHSQDPEALEVGNDA